MATGDPRSKEELLVELDQLRAELVEARRVADQALADCHEQLRQHSRQLEHLSRLTSMGELVAGITHEVNQPLYVIANFSAAISQALDSAEPIKKDELRHWTAEITRAVARADSIIKRLRSYVSMTDARRTEIDMNILVEQTLAVVSLEARQNNTRIELDLERPLPVIWADRTALEQVLVNLLRNAIEAMLGQPPKQRNVVVTTRAQDGGVEVAVKDRGAGVSEEAMSRLFTPFYTSKESGMGLGLAISKKIVEAHQGRIWATHNAHQGSTFHIMLPPAGQRVSAKEKEST